MGPSNRMPTADVDASGELGVALAALTLFSSNLQTHIMQAQEIASRVEVERSLFTTAASGGGYGYFRTRPQFCSLFYGLIR